MSSTPTEVEHLPGCDPGLERGCVECLVVDVRQRVPHDEVTLFIERIPTENCRPACHTFPDAGTTWSNWTGPPDQPVWSASVSSAWGYRRPASGGSGPLCERCATR